MHRSRRGMAFTVYASFGSIYYRFVGVYGNVLASLAFDLKGERSKRQTVSAILGYRL